VVNVPTHRLFAFAVAAAIAASVSAQQGAVRGNVRDQDFGAPLGGVKVTVVETGLVVESSDQGSYSIPQLAPGRYTLVFAKDGYVRLVRTGVVVSAGQLTDLDVQLAGDFTDLEEFVVQDVLQAGGSTEAGLLALRFESPALMDSVGAELMSRAGASDAASALRLVSGASLQDGKSAVIRGLPDRYVSSQLNGVRMPTADADKRAVELDQFPSEVIESIQVSKTFTPDQQGDASGGAVDVRLKGVPTESFFRYKVQTQHNTQVTGRSNFLTYDGGGLDTFGRGSSRRSQQLDRLGQNWSGAVGVDEAEAPLDYKMSTAFGTSFEVADGWRLGGMFSGFYERDSAYTEGVDESWVVENPGQPMSPKTVQGTPQDGDFKTALFDVRQGKQSVQWSSLATVGLQSDRHAVQLLHLYTHGAEDTATIAEDTRGKQYYYPGYDPADPNSPGFFQFNSAPYLRLQTLTYQERTSETLQLSGKHSFDIGTLEGELAPTWDWTVSQSSARSNEPDKRQFGSLWTPGFDLGGGLVFPPSYIGFKPGAVFTLGNLQRVWEVIEEKSEQASTNFKVPFRIGEDREGYFKTGYFSDRVTRTFDQDTFSNFNDNTGFSGPWEQYWSNSFPFESHPISASEFDVDYRGKMNVEAGYLMLDVPVLERLSLIGGVRVESTKIGIVNQAEPFATWLPPGSTAPTQLNPGDADVDFSQDDVLPSLGAVLTPADKWTLRLGYSETIARQTFKELSPILQQEYAGGPIFIGNPDLEMSSLKNYDVRLDYAPYQGGLFSVSWFYKDLEGPIEYVQRISSFDFTTPVNYPKGTLSGWEFETRHSLGHYVDMLEGVGLGANATLLDSSVTLPEDEQLAFQQPNINAPMSERPMTSAPEHLYNLFLTWDIEPTGTQLGLFYTVTGDTLVAGAGESNGRYIPTVFATETDRLNFSLTQSLGKGVKLVFQAKNLTDPAIREVYRGDTIGDDVTKTSYHEGIDYTLSIGGEIRF
jgi:TonB-dependent receptor